MKTELFTKNHCSFFILFVVQKHSVPMLLVVKRYISFNLIIHLNVRWSNESKCSSYIGWNEILHSFLMILNWEKSSLFKIAVFNAMEIFLGKQGILDWQESRRVLSTQEDLRQVHWRFAILDIRGGWLVLYKSTSGRLLPKGWSCQVTNHFFGPVLCNCHKKSLYTCRFIVQILGSYFKG